MWLKQTEPAPPLRAEIIGPAVVEAPVPVVAVCKQCGRIESVNVTETRGAATGAGAMAGGLAGAVAGHQFGRGNGKKAMTAIGLVGGVLAGHEAEKLARVQRTWIVNVRMESGQRQSFSQSWEPPWRLGDRVRVVDGRVFAR